MRAARRHLLGLRPELAQSLSQLGRSRPRVQTSRAGLFGCCRRAVGAIGNHPRLRRVGAHATGSRAGHAWTVGAGTLT